MAPFERASGFPRHDQTSFRLRFLVTDPRLFVWPIEQHVTLVRTHGIAGGDQRPTREPQATAEQVPHHRERGSPEGVADRLGIARFSTQFDSSERTMVCLSRELEFVAITGFDRSARPRRTIHDRLPTPLRAEVDASRALRRDVFDFDASARRAIELGTIEYTIVHPHSPLFDPSTPRGAIDIGKQRCEPSAQGLTATR
jgi:hypothetical protein